MYPGRSRGEADVEHLLAVRPLRWGGPRAADDGCAPSRPRPAGGADRLPRPRGRRPGRVAGGAGRGAPFALTRGTFAAWHVLSPRPRRRPGSAGACCGSRTTRCFAARAGSSTISPRSPARSTRPSSAPSSPTPGSRSTRPRRSRSPGVVGVLTGADVAALSRPFPAGIETGVPQYAAAIDTVRYVGEPLAVVVATRPLPRGGRSRARRGGLRPARRGARPGRGRRPSAVHDRSFSYGDVDGAMAEADLVLRQTFRFPRFTCTPVECYAVVADWDATAGRLTAWANFQGPFTLHGVAAAALGLKGDRLRLLTPPDSGGSFGIKSSVFAYVVLMGLAARAPRRARELDRGPARAPRRERRRDRPHDGGRGGLHGRRTADRAPLRRDRGRRRVRPRARAGDALPHARLALGRLPRPERRRAEPRRAHEHDPVRAQPRLRRPAALPRPRADDGDRRAPPRPRPRRARPPQPDPGRGDALPHALGRALRLRRLRGLPRRRARARRLRRAAGTGGSAAGRRRPRGDRPRVHRRALDLEHGLHHARPDRRRASARRCRSRATPRAPRSRSIRTAASPCGSRRRRRARATARSARRSSQTCSAARPRTSR